jgi:hypothetical protein
MRPTRERANPHLSAILADVTAHRSSSRWQGYPAPSDDLDAKRNVRACAQHPHHLLNVSTDGAFADVCDPGYVDVAKAGCQQSEDFSLQRSRTD